MVGDSDYTFNKIASAGGNIIKKPVYFVEKRGWYVSGPHKGMS
jgi:hypothetical protein